MESFIIPSKIKGVKVRSIGKGAFKGCSIESIIIPDSVEEIGPKAFADCGMLLSVSIPPSVKRIEKKAFYGCSRLGKIEIPTGVESTGKKAFIGCKCLTSV